MRRQIERRIMMLQEEEKYETEKGSPPEWYNRHDYESGYWMALHDARKEELSFLKNMLDKDRNRL